MFLGAAERSVEKRMDSITVIQVTKLMSSRGYRWKAQVFLSVEKNQCMGLQ